MILAIESWSVLALCGARSLKSLSSALGNPSAPVWEGMADILSLVGHDHIQVTLMRPIEGDTQQGNLPPSRASPAHSWRLSWRFSFLPFLTSGSQGNCCLRKVLTETRTQLALLCQHIMHQSPSEQF